MDKKTSLRKTFVNYFIGKLSNSMYKSGKNNF